MLFLDKSVVITGAGSGIGRALAKGFSDDGAQVIGIARTLEDLKKTAAMCSKGKMHYVVGDVSKEEDVSRLFTEAIDRFGKVDILINNAAVYPKTELLKSTHSEWINAMDININGLVLCTRLVLPSMLERRTGRIINMGSFAWKNPISKSSAYSASKAAVRAFTKALAQEIDRSKYPDILVNELVPGVVKTSMSDRGEDPETIYQHACFVASLPANGPTGQTFFQSHLHQEDHGIRARLKRFFFVYFRS